MAVAQIQGVPQGLVEEEIPQQQNPQAVQGVPQGLTEEALPPAANPTLDAAKANIAKYPVHEENHWMGKLVPQAALPAMQKFTESAPIQAAEAVGQKGAQVGRQLGRDVVTGADVLTHPMESLSAAMPSPYGPKPAMRPMEQTAAEEHPVAMGAASGIGEAVGGLADPRMAALAVLSGGVDEAYPVLSKIMSGAFGAQMGTQTVEGAKDLVQNWNNYTPEQRAELAARTGVDAYFTKEALGHTAPEGTADAMKGVGQRAVRMAGHGIENASRPVVAGPAIGGFIGSKLGSAGVGAAMGEGAAMLHPRPTEPMIRVPKMTNFGKEAPRENFVRQDRSIYGPPVSPEPAAAPVQAPQSEAPVDKNHETLKTAYDKANADFQKAHEARQAYTKSIEQGVQPPVAVQKAYEKAEKALDEASFHLQAYEDGQKAQPQAEPAKPTEEFKPEPVPQVRGGQQQLPGGGVMGKPLQLPGEVPTEAPEHANVADLRARMVPAKEAAGLYEPEPEHPMSERIDKAKAAQQVTKTGDLIQQGLGGKALEPNVPLREQVQGVPEGLTEEVLPPVKEEAPTQPVEEPKTIEAEVEHPRHLVHANGEALSNAIPKTAEGSELLQKLHDLSNVELRQLAINAGEDMGQLKIGRGKASGNIGRPEVFERMLKNHSAEDLGRMVDEGKHQPSVNDASAAAPKAEEPKVEAPKAEAPKELNLGKNSAFAQEIHEKYNSLVKYANEEITDPQERADYLKAARTSRDTKLAQLGQGGGAQGASAAPERAGTEEGAKQDTDLFAKAKAELGEGASISQVAQRAQEMKDALKAKPEAASSGDSLKEKAKKLWESIRPSWGKLDEAAAKERAAKMRATFRRVPLSELDPRLDIPRMTEKQKTALVNDIKKNGIKEPILIGKDPDGSLRVLDGSHRVRAAIEAGLTDVPAIQFRDPEPQAKPITEQTYQDIADNHNKHNGFSYNMRQGFVRDQPVFSVGGEHPDLVKVVRGRKLSAEDVKSFMKEPEVNIALQDPQNSVGGWNYKGNAHLEVSKMFTDKDEAIEAAKRMNQTAIYDHATRTEIPTGGTAADQVAAKFAPEASMKTARMSDSELKDMGFTQSEIDAGQHLPAVSGGAPGEGKELIKHITPEERKGVEASDREVEKFLSKMEEIPSIQEYKDIALAGEGARHWYQRSSKAFDAMMEESPDYFKEGDKDKFIGMLAGSSPRQSVAMNLRETLRGWKAYVDAGRPEMSVDGWQDFLKKTDQAWKDAGKPKGKFWDYKPEGEEYSPYNMMAENFTPAKSKVPNIIRALSGQEMWPDLTKNAAFKVPSFAKNLKGWLNYTTNDGWMALFGGLSPDEITKPSSYHPLSLATRAAAKELGWDAAEAQAAIWSFTQALTEAGEEDPKTIRAYSEDFADLLAHDPQVRDILQDLGVNHDQLDAKLSAIGEKPEVTGRSSATTSRSVGKLKERIGTARGAGTIPPAKSAQGSFEFREAPAHEGRNRIAEPGTENEQDVTFNPDELNERVTPEATNATRKMSDAELLEHGFTQDEIDAGKHLPSVSGASEDSDEKQPLWHSKAAKIAEEKLGGKGSGDQFLATLKNNGVKGDELQALGLEDYLKGKDKVTKQELLDHIDKNQIKLSETTRGEEKEETPELKAKKEAYAKLQETHTVVSREHQDALDKVNTIFNRQKALTGETPFSVWNFLGSTPERQERMLEKIKPTVEKPAPATQPSLFAGMAERAPKGTKKPVRVFGDEPTPWPQETYNKFVEAAHEAKLAKEKYESVERELNRTPDPNRSSDDNDTKFEQWTLGHGEDAPKTNYREKLIQLPVKEGEAPFVRASHFSEPNVVAHTRYDDRIDADGKKNLFVEEVQSDWHQKGREDGYRTKDKEHDFKAELEPDSHRWKITNKEGETIHVLSKHVADTPEAALEYYQNQHDDRVPDAPFKNDWHELAMKRMLREAAEKGYDRLSWTTGDQQADRYNLSKQVSKVSYDPETKAFRAFNNSGREMINKQVPLDQVKDYIGNELAKKLSDKVNEPKKERDLNIEHDPEQGIYRIMEGGREIDSAYSLHSANRIIREQESQSAAPSLEGLDLKVGGEWARALYDRAIPNFVNKYLKKFNVKVGETTFPSAEENDAEWQTNLNNAVRNFGVHSEQYQKALESPRSTGYKVHSIDITPEMKKELKKSAPIAENENDKSPYDVA